MIGQKNPGGEQESLPRAHSVQRPRQDGEVLFVEVVVPRENARGISLHPTNLSHTPLALLPEPLWPRPATYRPCDNSGRVACGAPAEGSS